MVPRIPRNLSAASWSGRPASSLQLGSLASTHPALAGALTKAIDAPYEAGWNLEARRSSKLEREWALALPGGTPGQLRRPHPADACRLALFLERTPLGADPRPGDPVATVERVKELLWQAATSGEDAFILSKRGEVLGFAAIERRLEVCELPLDMAWLAGHGLAPEEVCISRMGLAGELRGHGLGHHLKQAQVLAAGDAGYRAVASPGGHRLGRALAARAGGLVQTTAASGWVLVPTRAWDGAGKPFVQ